MQTRTEALLQSPLDLSWLDENYNLSISVIERALSRQASIACGVRMMNRYNHSARDTTSTKSGSDME